jgi:hypothetical protein
MDRSEIDVPLARLSHAASVLGGVLELLEVAESGSKISSSGVHSLLGPVVAEVREAEKEFRKVV